MSDPVLSASARQDLQHFSPKQADAPPDASPPPEATGPKFDLGASLAGVSGVLKRKAPVDDSPGVSGTPGAPAGGETAPEAPQKQHQPHGPPDDGPPDFDEMPEEPDWDEMAMMEAEAASFAADYQEPPSDIPADDAPQPAEADQRKRAPPAEEDSLFDDFDAPVVQPEPVSKRPRTADKPSRQYVFRVAPLGGVVTITNDAGDQVFCSTLAPPGLPEPKAAAGGDAELSLTGAPFDEMVREAEAYNHRKAVEEAVARDEVDKENAPGDAEATPARKQLAHTLWVDKYRPSRFIELMSNGKVNRNVLLWLTQWKNFAEGKGPVEKKRPPAQKKVKFDSQSQPEKDGGGGGGGFRKPWEADVLEELDEDGRPGCKLLLLAGPPGVGKTTMAHVLARHAGFEVIEINASDERTANGLREKVENATQMNSVLQGLAPGQVARPNAIILDEIDGAMENREGKGAITELIKLASAKGKKASKKDNDADAEGEGDDDEPAGGDQAKASKKKGSSTPKLSRPIICICNDLWAPSLKELRDVAHVFQFLPTPPRTMAKRLTEICRKESGSEPDRSTPLCPTRPSPASPR